MEMTVESLAAAVVGGLVKTASYDPVRPHSEIVDGSLRLRLDRGSDHGLTVGLAAEVIASLMAKLRVAEDYVAAARTCRMYYEKEGGMPPSGRRMSAEDRLDSATKDFFDTFKGWGY